MKTSTRLFFVVALLTVGCDGSSGTPDAASSDAATPVDAAAPVDAATPVDAADPDAGLPADAGDSDDDAGAPIDAGPVETDAGEPTDLTFRVIDAALPDGVGTARGLELFTSEAALAAYFGGVAPAGVDFSRERALLYTEGARPFPGHLASVTALALTADGSGLLVDTHHRAPGPSCEVLGLERVAFQLVAFDAIPTEAAERAHTTSTFDCAASGADEGAACSPTTLCGADLICGNLTRGISGLCYPTSFWGSFFDRTGGALADDGVTTRTLDASGLASVDVDVIAYVELTHPDPSELRITLTNPSANEVLVFDREAAAGPLVLARVPSGFSGDESVNGVWTLRITDHAPGNTGTLTGWGVEIVSRLD